MTNSRPSPFWGSGFGVLSMVRREFIRAKGLESGDSIENSEAKPI